MEIVNRISRMSAITAKILSADVKIGLVSTRGAIHPGHISLIQTARKMSDLVVVSIFVNRLEFLSDQEYQKYPRDIAKDLDLLRHKDVDYIFNPSQEEMYPAGFSTYVELDKLGNQFPELPQGVFFRGLPTSVLKLIHIIKPSFIFLGQKDGLQGAILRKMIRDLNINIEVVAIPVVRDPSGLAYAAHNSYLTESQKTKATVIYRSLKAAEHVITEGEVQSKKIITNITQIIEAESEVKLTYALIMDAKTLEPVSKIQGTAFINVGALIGDTPLNDSLLIEKRAKP